VISDNQDSSIDAINAKQVTALIATQLSIIAALLIKVSEIAALITAPEPQLFYQLLEHYHFTAQQRQQLKSQLSRWDTLTDHQSLLLEATNLVSGKDVLLWLDSRLNMIKFYL